jgi:hypothetical protein
MNLSHLVPPELVQLAPDPYEVEANLPPAVRRAVRLARIAAYERTPSLAAQFLLGEQICVEFDV